MGKYKYPYIVEAYIVRNVWETIQRTKTLDDAREYAESVEETYDAVRIVKEEA